MCSSKSVRAENFKPKVNADDYAAFILILAIHRLRLPWSRRCGGFGIDPEPVDGRANGRRHCSHRRLGTRCPYSEALGHDFQMRDISMPGRGRSVVGNAWYVPFCELDFLAPHAGKETKQGGKLEGLM